MRRLSLWTTLPILISIPLAAQQPPVTPEFDAVSIKPGDPAATGHMSQSSAGSFRAGNLRLFELIMGAWHLNRNQIVGGPKWLETAGWDIEARLPPGTAQAQLPQMIKAMLAERFQLVTHRETRTLPVYRLSLAKGGIKLHEGDGTGGMSAGQRLIRYRSGTMRELASQLTSYLGREVIDDTGLTGQYAINLSFAPVDPGVSAADAALESLPSIFQALQEQAGLKLESGNGPVEMLVIDRADKPTPN